MLNRIVRGLTVIAAFVAVASIGLTPSHTTMASHAGGATAFSIDMDPDADPVNFATSLGSRESCARMALNGVQDADEDVIDGVRIDVTVNQIPATTAAIGFVYALYYSEPALTVAGYTGAFILAANDGSSIFDASDAAPDADGDNRWVGAEADTGTGSGVSESGSGVLQRIAVKGDVGAPTGVYDLTLSNSGHIDEANAVHAPDTYGNARLAVGIACPPADTDSDGVWDADEAQCGSDPYSAASRPERIDGVFAGVSDDGDAEIDEALPANIPMADCDGDGYSGTAEAWVYSPSAQADQDPCGAAPASAPFSVPIGWPADLVGGGVPDSTNKITLSDWTSYLSPVRRLDTSPGDPGYDRRWDIVPGNSGMAKDINSVDFNNVTSVAPAMLGSVRAFNGPPCPWPP